MEAMRVIRSDYLRQRMQGQRQETAILATLREFDPDVSLLSAWESAISLDLISNFWRALPDESQALKFASVGELAEMGRAYLPFEDLASGPAMLHLGHSQWAVRTTLEAAWNAGPALAAHGGTDFYNTCFYPETFEGFVCRAGPNLYPMDCRGETPVLRTSRA